MIQYQVRNKSELEALICHNWNRINQYLDENLEKLPVPIYTSVDIRESINKFAPVDNNLYPAGFNNICGLDLISSADEFEKFIKKFNPAAKNVGIIPESHTKNLFYLDHLAVLKKCLEDAGFNVYLISPDIELFDGKEHIDLISNSQFDVQIQKCAFVNQEIQFKHNHQNIKLDFIILNNDQSKELDFPWASLKIPVHPTPFLGWTRRQKATHFEHYQAVCNKFCEEFSILPELLQAKFKVIRDVDFMDKAALEVAAGEVDSLLKTLPEGTKIFVKANQGTYGMGITVVDSGADIINMNRKDRNKMDIGKNNIKFTSILIQESIETMIKYDSMPAEVTIYLVGGKSVGGFVRANSLRSTQANLNAKGMVYQKFCISEIRQHQDHKCKEATYSIVARLSTLATALEIHQSQTKGK